LQRRDAPSNSPDADDLHIQITVHRAIGSYRNKATFSEQQLEVRAVCRRLSTTLNRPSFVSMAIIYVDDEAGTDAPDIEARGTEAAPFKSLPQAYLEFGPDHEYHVKKDEEYKPATKSALKKAVKFAEQQQKKRDARAEKEAQDKAALEATIERAKNIKITQDPGLPEAVHIRLNETDPSIIGQLRKGGQEPKDQKTEDSAVRVRVRGRVQRVAKQGSLIFVVIRRGLDLMQCVLSGELAKAYDALTLSRETSIEIFGQLWEVPAGAHAPLDRELQADYFEIIAKAPGGEDAFSNRVPEDAEANPNLRHLALRTDKPASIMFVRGVVESAFHAVYKELGFAKVVPPTLVTTQCEGGATLFGLNYYGETAYLTQSSQLYLETILPSLGDVYSIEKSFRAEKSLTRRHVSHSISMAFYMLNLNLAFRVSSY
jgi:asparaginyl-tRNA synthetase